MAKLKTNPIVAADLIQYLEEQSDFAFEIKVLRVIILRGYNCEHGGTYIDPVTKKSRQFDIRAIKTFNRTIIRLAVECKNLGPSFPLLVSCVPRTPSESFHDVVVAVDGDQVSLLPNTGRSSVYMKAMEPTSRSARLRGNDSIYKVGDFVGKSANQVGRDLAGGISASDSETYDKWSQALHSADDLAHWACHQAQRGEHSAYFTFILPVLVIPDGTLWVTRFDENGNRVLDPQLTDRCSLFLNKSYYDHDAMHWTEYRVSHLELVTVSGLDRLMTELESNDMEDVFPKGILVERIKAYMQTGKLDDGAI